MTFRFLGACPARNHVYVSQSVSESQKSLKQAVAEVVSSLSLVKVNVS